MSAVAADSVFESELESEPESESEPQPRARPFSHVYHCDYSHYLRSERGWRSGADRQCFCGERVHVDRGQQRRLDYGHVRSEWQRQWLGRVLHGVQPVQRQEWIAHDRGADVLRAAGLLWLCDYSN